MVVLVEWTKILELGRPLDKPLLLSKEHQPRWYSGGVLFHSRIYFLEIWCQQVGTYRPGVQYQCV